MFLIHKRLSFYKKSTLKVQQATHVYFCDAAMTKHEKRQVNTKYCQNLLFINI